MSFEKRKDYFRDQSDLSLAKKYSSLTLDSDVNKDVQKETDEQKNNLKEKGERQSNWRSKVPDISEDRFLYKGFSSDFNQRYKSTSNQALGWRDVGFRYERNTSQKSVQNRGNYSGKERMRNFNYNASKEHNSFNWIKESTELKQDIDKDSKCKNSGNSYEVTTLKGDRGGFWGLECFQGDKYVDTEYVWATINQIYDENSELFASPPTKEQNFINCYTQDFEDVQHIKKLSNIIRQKLKYPLVFYYYTEITSRLYLSACDGDMYIIDGDNGWKAIDI